MELFFRLLNWKTTAPLTKEEVKEELKREAPTKVEAAPKSFQELYNEEYAKQIRDSIG